MTTEATVTTMPARPPKGIPRAWDGRRFRWAWRYATPPPAVLVARYDGPDGKVVVPFVQDATGKWTPGAPPEPRPLYGLDSLRWADDFVAPVHPLAGAVVLVEGEKCAAALHGLSVACVASMGGARAAAQADWAPLARFNRVYVWPDRDEAGEGYAADVVRILAGFPGAREITIVRPPGLPAGGDCVDWLQARLPEWDAYGPPTRDAGDDLLDELVAVFADHGAPVPADWLALAATPGRAVDGAVWETPVSLDAATLPQWPRDVFPGPVQAFVDALSVSTETPVELPAMLTLAVLAGAVQGRYVVQVGDDYREPLSLWTCTALPSGSRKTSVWQAVTAPLVAWERAERERVEPERVRLESERKSVQSRIDTLRTRGSKEDDPKKFDAIKAEILDLEALLPEVPPVPQCWCADVTPETLPVIMAQNKDTMVLLSDEGGIFDTLAGRYSGNVPNLDCVLQSHAGSPVRVNRGSRPAVFLERPALSVGICPQPDVVRALQSKTGFRGRGLLARLLYAMPESTLGRRTLTAPPVPADVREGYAAAIRAILAAPWPEDPHVLALEPGAVALWHEFALEVEGGLGPAGVFAHLTDWAGKLPGAVARIAGVLHVAERAHGEPAELLVSTGTMGAAIRLGRVLSAHALIAFAAMGADPALDDARAVLDWVQRTGRETFTVREVQRSINALRTAATAKVAVEVLVERGYLQLIPRPVSPRGGRPSAAYAVNPNI